MSNQRMGRLKRGDSDDETEGPQVIPDSHRAEQDMEKKQAFASLRGPDIDDDGARHPPSSHKVSVATYDVPYFGGVSKEGTDEDIFKSGEQSSVARYHGMASVAHYHGTAAVEEEPKELPLREELDNSRVVAAVSLSGGQSRAPALRSTNYRLEPPLPGAFREGGSSEDDEETVLPREDEVQPDKLHLVEAELVQAPILVSAAKLTWYVLLRFWKRF